MLQREAPRGKSECNWAEIKARRSPRRRRSQSAPLAPNPTYMFVLPALIAARHGAATIAFCLGVSIEWVLEQAIALDLPSPSGRSMRRPGGKNPWTAEQIQQLILLWPTNLYATCIGESVGRSAASVRYKAKWLGLPARDRAKLTRSLPDAGPVASTDSKGGYWTKDLGYQVGFRYLRGQHTAGIARDMGREFTSVSSHVGHIGLVGRHSLGRLKMDHNPADPMLEKFAKEDWVYRQCNFNAAQWFWAPRLGERTSPASKKSRAYKDRLASGGAETDGDFFDD